MNLSVVVPVYNVSSLLNRCVESILHQAVDGMEVILVDDGSTDESGLLCDEWARKEKCVKAVHQSNQGLSGARNTGISLATGHWITFVDSDDYLAPGTYRVVMEDLQAEDDFIEFPVQRFCGSDKESPLVLNKEVFHDAKEYWITHQGFAHAYAWNKIYRKSLFESVCYPQGVIFEDVHTMPLVLSRVKQIRTTNRGLYYYCYNPNGITATATGQHLQSLLHAHVDYWPVESSAFYYLHVLNIQLDVCRLTGEKPILPSLRIHIDKNLPWKLKIKAFLLNIIGISRLCRLNKLIWKIRCR